MEDDVPTVSGPPGSGVNPNGGGGDQFIHVFTQRQGDYGLHQTVKGKIVYQRPRHYFSSADLERIIPRAAKTEEELGEFLWWQKLINFVADWIIDKIKPFDSAGELLEAAWAWTNEFWMKLVIKWTGSNSFAENTQRLYGEMFKDAIDRYVREGNQEALERLYNLLTGGNNGS